MYSCRKTCVLWWEILRWVNRMGPFPLQPNCHFLQFSQWSGNSKVDNRWKALWIALSMTIWKHRNALVFNNQNFCTEKVTASALFHTWSWINCMEKDFHTHFNQWSTCLKEEMSQGFFVAWVTTYYGFILCRWGWQISALYILLYFSTSSTDPINIIRFLLCKKKINTNYNFADKKKIIQERQKGSGSHNIYIEIV